MKNREKYAEEIKKYKDSYFCSDFIKPYVLKSNDCDGMTCEQCRMLQMLWLEEEYVEEVDWSNVAVDTPILVRNNEYDKWSNRYFAKYEDGEVYAWCGGRTSWNETNMFAWKCAKLAEMEGEE